MTPPQHLNPFSRTFARLKRHRPERLSHNTPSQHAGKTSPEIPPPPYMELGDHQKPTLDDSIAGEDGHSPGKPQPTTPRSFRKPSFCAERSAKVLSERVDLFNALPTSSSTESIVKCPTEMLDRFRNLLLHCMVPDYKILLPRLTASDTIHVKRLALLYISFDIDKASFDLGGLDSVIRNTACRTLVANFLRPVRELGIDPEHARNYLFAFVDQAEYETAIHANPHMKYRRAMYYTNQKEAEHGYFERLRRKLDSDEAMVDVVMPWADVAQREKVKERVRDERRRYFREGKEKEWYEENGMGWYLTDYSRKLVFQGPMGKERGRSVVNVRVR
jgi:hypothetical protein